jgi:indolepyruvate ferredoxin oxidoreductase beta subunit
VRFGDKIYSSLVLKGEAHLVIGLELLETLRACDYGSKESKTIFLIDNYRIIPLSVSVLGEKYQSLKEIVKKLKLFSKKVITLNASEAVKKETGSIVSTNVFLLGYASSKKLIPIRKKFLLKGIEKIVPERHLEMNKKVFELGVKI